MLNKQKYSENSLTAEANTYGVMVDKLIEFTPYVDKDYVVEFVKLANGFRDVQVQECSKETSASATYLDLEDVCRLYHLPRGRVKDRTWRKEHGFPIGNTQYGAKLSFSNDAVKVWMDKHYNKSLI